MKFALFLVIVLCSSLNVIGQGKEMADEADSKEIMMVREMIEAVNTRDADMYIKDFSDNIKIMVDGDIKVSGKSALKANRSEHFTRYPKVRSEIQHVVMIENKVILHDKVWLKGSEGPGSDIVEIFTFEDGQIISVEVIQSSTLLEEAAKKASVEDIDH